MSICVMIEPVEFVHRCTNGSRFHSRPIEKLGSVCRKRKEQTRKPFHNYQPKKLIDFWFLLSLFPVSVFRYKTLRALTLRPVEANQNTFWCSLLCCHQKRWSIDDRNRTMRFTVKQFNRFSHAKRFRIIAFPCAYSRQAVAHNSIWHPTDLRNTFLFFLYC